MSAGLDKLVADSMLKVKVGRTITDYWYLTSFSTTATWTGGAAQKVYNPSQTSFIDAQVLTPLNDRHALTWGATNQYDNAEAYRYNMTDWRNADSFNGAQTDHFAGKTSTLGLFVQDEWAAAQDVSVFVGARWDGWKGSNGTAYQATPAVSAAYPSRTASAVSPRMGIAYRFSPDIVLRTSMGTAFRAPNVFDLYRPFPTSTATGTYTGNNPNLNPEKMKSVDFGGDANLWSGAALKASVYFNYFTDMMYNKPVTTLAEAQLACPGIVALNFNTATGQKCQQKTNIGAANSRGLELKLAQAVTHSISTWVTGTWMRSEITKNDSNPAAVGKRFTQVPHKTAGLGVDYENGTWSSSVAAMYRGRQYSSSDDINAQKVWGVWSSYDAYTTVDAKVSYRFAKSLKLSLAIDNLFNKNAYSYYRIQGRAWVTEISGSL
jgi:iron complex outermembrane receptor protein